MRCQRALIIVWILFFSFQCKKAENHRTDIFRFIDNIKKHDIISSPLLDRSFPGASYPQIYPSDSLPIKEKGIKDNPFELKRRITLYNKEEAKVLFSFGQSEYRKTFKLPENPVFEFGIGLWRKKQNTPLKKNHKTNKKGAVFIATAESGKREKIIFQKYIEISPQHKKFTFSRHRVSLPYKEELTIHLKTLSHKSVSPFWINPAVYNRENKKTNIILISIDTLRADHLACYGYKRNTSPNIDKLASESAVFKNNYSTSPWTLPAHVSLFTSLYEVKHQVSKEDEGIRPFQTTLSGILKNNGYFCAAITGGGFVSSLFGFSQGFDSYTQHNIGVFSEEAARWTYEQTSKWLDRNKDKNFFLFIHTYQTHTPYACPSPYNTMFCHEDAKWDSISYQNHLGGNKGRYQIFSEDEQQNIIDIYDGEIRYTDEILIKPLIEKLKSLSLYRDALIIFTSDHGEEFYDHKGWGHSHSLYNELLKVPLIIKFPDNKYAGENFDNIVRLVDIMPTILDEINVGINQQYLDGKSLFPILKHKETSDRTFLAYKQGYLLNHPLPEKYAMNDGTNKLIFNKELSKKERSYFIESPPLQDKFELYDLDLDSLELKNLASEKPNLVRDIFRRIENFNKKIKKIEPSKLKVDEKIKKKLKALGYIH